MQSKNRDDATKIPPAPRTSEVSTASPATRVIFDPVADACNSARQELGRQDARDTRSTSGTEHAAAVDLVGDTQRMKTARPYRSHKYPACSRCHKRRSRCTIEVPGQACLLCRINGVACSAESTSTAGRPTPSFGFVHRSALTNSQDINSLVVGPGIAQDTTVLEDPIPDAGSSTETGLAYVSTSGFPIYQTAIPPHRPDLPGCSCTARLAQETLQQIEPSLEGLIMLYFEDLHPCLPIMDESSMCTRLRQRTILPKTFVLNFAAYTMFYWSMSSSLANHARPDQDAVWQAAVASMNGDSQRGDLLSITAAILNVAGRPSKRVIHNTGNVARITALAHGIGLNHKCDGWRLTEAEIHTRSKIWWAVLIHDRWFNFAQGTPTYISRNRYDVSLPSVSMLVANRSGSIKHVQAAECYIQLCRLTEVVGELLPLIYQVRSGHDANAPQSILQAELDLNQWLISQPAWLDINDLDNRSQVPGLPNLQLSYLAVRMLLKRISWHENYQQGSNPNTSWLLDCQMVANEIVHFVLTLKPHEMAGFWLPYNAHHLASAVTLLLRCSMQSDVPQVRLSSFNSAKQLVECLTMLRDSFGWDMAEIALMNCVTTFRKVEEAIQNMTISFSADPTSFESTATDTTPDQGNIGNDYYTSELHFPSSGPQPQASIEELFPELFSDLTENVFLHQPFS